MDWNQSFLSSLQQGSVSGMVAALQSQSTAHAGTAPAKVKYKAIQLLRKDKLNASYALIEQLCGHENWTAQEVGAICLTDFYETNGSEVEQWLRHLADSESWEVREWAANACGDVLEKHFATFLPMMTKWAQDESENVRRAVVLACKYAAKSRRPEFAQPLLAIVESLLDDRSRYVSDNLGPFAIGDTLIASYPAQVLQHLGNWVQNEDEQVRWNIAMVFTAAEGAKYAHEAKSIFDVLLTDERPYVMKAVAKAQNTIQKRDQSR